jgi:hypothetical protein
VRRPTTRRVLLAGLALLVLLVVGVVVVGEVWVRPTVEDEIAKGLVSELDLAAKPDVHLDGFPLVLRALQQRLDGIDVSVRDEVFEGLRVRQVELHIDDIRFDTSELLRGTGTIAVSGGDGRAEIADTDLSSYLQSTGLPVDVEFTAGSVRVSGRVTVSGVTADASVTGDLVLEANLLRFTPETVDVESVATSVDVATIESIVRRQFAFTAPVPQLEGVRLVAVEIGDGVATIDARFESLTVDY